MKRLFNGTCSECQQFKPRCAFVLFCKGDDQQYEDVPRILCESCRHNKQGQYKLGAAHR